MFPTAVPVVLPSIGTCLRQRRGYAPTRKSTTRGSACGVGGYGGYLTAMGLARNSDLFAAGVDFHGVHDWNKWQAWVTDTVDDDDPLARASSPVASLDTWRSPVLLVHGDDDHNVPFSETRWLVRELASRGVEHEVLVFPDEVHSFLLHENWVKAFEATADFFQRHLGERDS